MALLITQAEIEDLPEDPRQRFVRIEQICRERHHDDITNESEWGVVQDSRLRYMSTVVAAAKFYKIEPIDKIEIPRKSDWNDDRYQDFVAELEFYTVQLMLEAAETNSRVSLILEGNTRDRLKMLTSHLKDTVRKLNLNPGQIDRLLKMVETFERELAHPRLKFVSVAILALAVVGAVADMGGATKVVRDLINEIETTVGVAKEEQNKEAASKALPAAPPRQLAAPRDEKPSPPKPARPATPPRMSDALDDDIPF